MTSQHDKPKRWRLRFSVRTLVIFVTLVCCYAACWGPTKRNGPRVVVNGENLGAYAVAPLLIRNHKLEISPRGELVGGTYYYFWFFGYVAKLPYERELNS